MIRKMARAAGQWVFVGEQQSCFIDVDCLGDEDEIDAVCCAAGAQVLGMEGWWALAVERIAQTGTLLKFGVQSTRSGDVEVSAHHGR